MNGTVIISMRPAYSPTFLSSATTFSCARSLVYGGLAKWIAVSSTPRFAIIHAATGLSRPPLMRTAARPPVPTGMPPAPGFVSPWMYAPFSRISTRTTMSGLCTSTERCGFARSSAPPTSREICIESSGNFLSARFDSTLKVRTSASVSSRYCGAVSRIASIAFGQTHARV